MNPRVAGDPGGEEGDKPADMLSWQQWQIKNPEKQVTP